MQQTIPVNDGFISSHVGSTPSTGPFAVDFPFFSLNDVVVTRLDDGSSLAVTLVRGADYTITGVATEDGSFSSGTVSLVLAVANCTITRTRDTPVERLSNFPLQGFFSRLALNAELNKMTVWMQEHDAGLAGFDDSLDNYLPLSGGTITGPVELGPAATVADPPGSDNDFSVANTRFVRAQVGNVITGLRLLGTWNALTNSPPLVSGVGLRGDFYICSVAGSTNLDGITTWASGDSVVFNGVTWQRVPQTLTSTQIISGLGYTPLDLGLIDAAGDLLLGTADNVAARLARGTAGQVLTATAGSLAWSSGMVLSSEQVLVGTSSAFQITFPATAKLVEIWFDLVTTTPGTNNAINLKAVQAGVPNTTAIYNAGFGVMSPVNTLTANTAAGAVALTLVVGTGAFGVYRLTRPANFKGQGNFATTDQAGILSQVAQSISTTGPITGVDGVQATTAGTFAVGSFLRAVVLA